MLAILGCRHTLLLVYVSVLCYSFSRVTASLMTFTSPQPSIQPGLTHDLSMRCSLTDTQPITTTTSSGRLVGRRRRDVRGTKRPVGLLQGSTGLLDEGYIERGRRGSVQTVTETADNVNFIVSMHIVRDGTEHIAMVSEHVAAKALPHAAGDVTVTGSVVGASGERGFLEISWRHPSQAQAGSYSCEATSLTDLGSTVFFSKTLNVSESSPTLRDIIGYIHELQIQNEKQLLNMTELQTKAQQQDTFIDQLLNSTQREIQRLEAKNIEQDSAITQLGSSITQLTATIKEHDNHQTDTVYCDDSGSWSGFARLTVEEGPHDFYTKNITVVFPVSYKTPPLVAVALQDAYWHDEAYAWPRLDALDITENGFTLRCALLQGGSTNKLEDVRVRWISMPR